MLMLIEHRPSQYTHEELHQRWNKTKNMRSAGKSLVKTTTSNSNTILSFILYFIPINILFAFVFLSGQISTCINILWISRCGWDTLSLCKFCRHVKIIGRILPLSFFFFSTVQKYISPTFCQMFTFFLTIFIQWMFLLKMKVFFVGVLQKLSCIFYLL